MVVFEKIINRNEISSEEARTSTAANALMSRLWCIFKNENYIFTACIHHVCYWEVVF